MTTTQTSVDEIVERYFAAWNTRGDNRPDAVAAAFAEDAYYCDGAGEAVGHNAITDMMAGVATQFEGARFELASPIDTHHQQARFAFRMEAPDGTTVIDGMDAIHFTPEGQVKTALGFFGVAIPEPSETSTSHTFHWDRTYDVAADQLFALVSNLDVYADVAPNLASITVLEGDGQGMVRQCTNLEGESWTETYTDWVAGERFVTVVDVATYPPSLAAMINSLEMTVAVDAVAAAQATVSIDIATELTDVGVQVLRDGGAADALFQPILDGWATHLSSGNAYAASA